MGKAYYTTFTVEGNSGFPLDMLRYDSCYPKTQEDTVTMDRVNQQRGTKRVTLVHIGETPHWSPTLARWEGFLWRVVEVKR